MVLGSGLFSKDWNGKLQPLSIFLMACDCLFILLHFSYLRRCCSATHFLVIERVLVHYPQNKPLSWQVLRYGTLAALYNVRAAQAHPCRVRWNAFEHSHVSCRGRLDSWFTAKTASHKQIMGEEKFLKILLLYTLNLPISMLMKCIYLPSGAKVYGGDVSKGVFRLVTSNSRRKLSWASWKRSRIQMQPFEKALP